MSLYSYPPKMLKFHQTFDVQSNKKSLYVPCYCVTNDEFDGDRLCSYLKLFPIEFVPLCNRHARKYIVNIMSSIMTHNNYVENASLTLMDQK